MLEASVDIALIGGGIQGVTLARELSPRYSVAVVTGSPREAETLHSHGFLSAGYQGTDPGCVRRARENTAYWRQTFAREGIPWSGEVLGLHSAEECQRWRGLGLTFAPAILPPLLGGVQGSIFRRSEDLVFPPATALSTLRRPLLDQLIEGRAEAFGHHPDGRISWVRVATDRGPRRLRTRFLVLTAGASNAALLAALLGQTRIPQVCQGLRQLHMLCVRGDLPAITGSFGPVSLVSHRLASGSTLWILTYRDHPEPPQAGPVDVRLEPAVIGTLLGQTLEHLAGWIGAFDSWAHRQEWAIYTGWKAECPSVCGPRPAPEPVGPHLDDFRLPNLLAVWPSLWGNAIGAAREASARIDRVLAGNPGGGSCRAELQLPAPASRLYARWESPELEWLPYAEFRALHSPQNKKNGSYRR